MMGSGSLPACLVFCVLEDKPFVRVCSVFRDPSLTRLVAVLITVPHIALQDDE